MGIFSEFQWLLLGWVCAGKFALHAESEIILMTVGRKKYAKVFVKYYETCCCRPTTITMMMISKKGKGHKFWKWNKFVNSIELCANHLISGIPNLFWKEGGIQIWSILLCFVWLKFVLFDDGRANSLCTANFAFLPYVLTVFFCCDAIFACTAFWIETPEGRWIFECEVFCWMFRRCCNISTNNWFNQTCTFGRSTWIAVWALNSSGSVFFVLFAYTCLRRRRPTGHFVHVLQHICFSRFNRISLWFSPA